MHKRKITAVTVAAATALATALTTAATAEAAPAGKAIPNTHPAWTAHAKHLGAAHAKSDVHARVYLSPRGGLAAVREAAVAMSTPGNARYHHFLTPAQYRHQFGTTKTTVRSVSGYLRTSGLKVTGVGAGNRYLRVTGNVKAAENAFGAQIERYQHHGRTVQAPASTLKVPAGVASSVLTVTGLDTTPSHARPASKQAAPPPAGFRNAHPCSIYYGQLKAKYQADFKTKLPQFKGRTLAYAPCGYTGPQYRAAYEGNSALDGTGITVGIVDAYAAPTIKKDANRYGSENGDGSYAKGQFRQTNPGTFTHQKLCGPSGWYGEETLDVEAVHAMAPGANIHYYGGKSCYDNDLTDTLAKVVDQDKVQLVTNSYGDAGEGVPTSEIKASEQVFLQGATEGISFLFSSGDSGDELANTGIKQPDYEASDPYVTAVGGTSTGIGASGALSFQTGWGTDDYTLSNNGKKWQAAGYLYGAGGGTSHLFNQPSYQAGVSHSAYRQVPDVAMDADPNTGMLVGETQTFSDGVYYDTYRIGGTSLASPLFAGMTALSLQKAGLAHGAGMLNPTIYKKAGSPTFTDIAGSHHPVGDVRVDFANGENASGGLSYSVRTFNQDSSLRTTKGYDLVTGVGVPTTKWLRALG